MHMRNICSGLVLITVYAATAKAAALTAPTFTKDVLPVLQEKCQNCHRPGQVAPMSFLNYQDVRPWAKAIKTAVATRKMPPWFADPQFGHFSNDRSLSQSEIDKLIAWVDGGALEGEAKDAPAVKQWPSGGWEVQPEIVLDGPEFEVPAKGVIDWFWVAIPGMFKEDTWITSIEFQPLDPGVVHHTGIAFVPHNPDVKYNEPMWERVERDASQITIPGQKQTFNPVMRSALGGREQDTYVSGHTLSDYRPYQAARLIPANTDVYLNLHYAPNGTPIRTHVRVGFTIAKKPPQRRVLWAMVSGPTDRDHFRIPAGDPDWAAVPGEVIFTQDAEIVSMMPHMRVRGKAMTYTLTYPDGKIATILN